MGGMAITISRSASFPTRLSCTRARWPCCLVPLGLLPFHGAYVLWVALIQLMILASLAILLFLEEDPRARLFFIPLLAGIVLFRPTILTLTQGQVSGLFLFGLAWIAFLWQKGKWFWGGLLLGLLALKPNLGVLVIGLLAHLAAPPKTLESHLWDTRFRDLHSHCRAGCQPGMDQPILAHR